MASGMTPAQVRQLQTLNPGATVSTTVPTYAEPPQEALTLLNQIMNKDPYAGVHQAYEDVARQMAGAYQQRGSQGARTQQQAALSTGLTPLEASGAGESALLENMRAYFAALPQLRLQQAMLPAQRQEQLGGLLGIIQQLYGQPGGSTTTTYPGQQTGQTQATQGATVPGYPGMTAQDVLALAQAAQLNATTSARKKMNELFYSGGLGPIAGGAMQQAQVNAWPSQYGPVAAGNQPQGAKAGGTSTYTQYAGTSPANRQMYEDIVLSSSAKRGT